MAEMLHPPGPDLAYRNRRILADRLHWPGGALTACEQIEGEAPGWGITWSRGGGVTWTRTGFYARPVHWPGSRRRPFVYGETPDELRAAVSDAEHLDRWQVPR